MMRTGKKKSVAGLGKGDKQVRAPVKALDLSACLIVAASSARFMRFSPEVNSLLARAAAAAAGECLGWVKCPFCGV